MVKGELKGDWANLSKDGYQVHTSYLVLLRKENCIW